MLLPGARVIVGKIHGHVTVDIGCMQMTRLCSLCLSLQLFLSSSMELKVFVSVVERGFPSGTF